MSLAAARVPVAISCSLISLLLGVGLGIVLMGSMGYTLHKDSPDIPDSGPGPNAMGPPGGDAGGGKGGMGMMGGMGGGKGGMGMMGGGMGGGMGMMGGRGGPAGGGGPGGAPRNKAQLASLVSKMNLLSAKPLTLTLTDEQRTKVEAELNGLADLEELTEEEAEKRLKTLMTVVEKDKDTLAAVGFRWPGGGGGGAGGGRPGMGGPGGPPEAKNPFKEGENADNLKGLQKTVAKPKG